MCKWISVKDRLPDGPVDVFFYDAEIGIARVGYRTGGEWTDYPGDFYGDEVSHWMPFTPPAEEASDDPQAQ